MPIYEYSCRDCGARTEVLQRMGEGPSGLTCPGCGHAALEKQFSTFAAGASDRGQADAACAAPGCGPGRFT